MGNESDCGGSNHSVIVDFLAGSVGAAASVFVGQPLDTIKVKMQAFPNMYPNFRVCFRKTLKKEGISQGLFAGTLPSLAANVAENGVLFAGYGVCRDLVAFMAGEKDVASLNVIENGAAGFLAAFFTSFALCPTELIKCRLQALREATKGQRGGKPQIGPLWLTADILKQEGVPGLFRGLRPTFMREMPGCFFFFCAYELSREYVTPEGQTKDDIGPCRTIMCGGIAGVVYWAIIFPADVIKSRQQVNNSTEPFMHAGLAIYRKEGLLALYSGLTPTLLRTFPATGALFFAYEYSRKFLMHYCL